MPLKHVRHILFQILKGIKHLNELGIVHRDLKPDNILLKTIKGIEEPGNIKIIDFGLACKVCEIDPSFKKCGTPGYIAPEVISTKTEELWRVLNSKLDVFSAGVIFHKFLFGKDLFDGVNVEEVLKMNLKGVYEVKSKMEMVTDVNCSQAADLVWKMLEFDPDQRISVNEALKHPFFDNLENNLALGEFKEVGLKREDNKRILNFGGYLNKTEAIFVDETMNTNRVEFNQQTKLEM